MFTNRPLRLFPLLHLLCPFPFSSVNQVAILIPSSPFQRSARPLPHAMTPKCFEYYWPQTKYYSKSELSRNNIFFICLWAFICNSIATFSVPWLYPSPICIVQTDFNQNPFNGLLNGQAVENMTRLCVSLGTYL